nr:hypothetical protein [Tanacetum cinerariifolium]
GSGDGVGCVVVVPAVERQRSGVGGGVVLEMVMERRGSVAAWVVVLAVEGEAQMVVVSYSGGIDGGGSGEGDSGGGGGVKEVVVGDG